MSFVGAQLFFSFLFRLKMSCQTAQKEALESYKQAMESLLGGNSVYFSDASLKAEHEEEKTKAVSSYREKIGCDTNNEKIAKEYEDQLLEVGCFERSLRS